MRETWQRPAGFMVLGTVRDQTVLIRVDAVDAIRERLADGGSVVHLRGGFAEFVVRESLGEVVEAMNIETRTTQERARHLEGGS